MQPIERYGVIALLFLMITIGAVVIWGPETDVGATAGHTPAVLASRTTPPLARERGPVQPRATKPPLSRRADGLLLAGREGAAQSSGVRAPRGGQDQAGTRLPAGAAARGTDGTLPATKAAQQKPPLAASGSNAGAASSASARNTTPGSRTTPALRGASRSPSPGSGRVYQVQPGDTLSEIAQAELGSANRWREIVGLNPRVVPERLKAGEKLLMPARGAQPVSASVATQKSAATRKSAGSRAGSKAAGARPGGAGTYRVQPGDTLGQIAEDHLGSWKRWKEIATLNPGVEPAGLQAGQSLVLPTGAVVAARIETQEWSPTGRGGVR